MPLVPTLSSKTIIQMILGFNYFNCFFNMIISDKSMIHLSYLDIVIFRNLNTTQYFETLVMNSIFLSLLAGFIDNS